MQRTREYPIQIRVTESEKRRLQRNARACRMTLSAYMRTVGLGKSVSAFPADEVHTLYSGFCRLRDEYPYRDLDWIERQFESLTKQFHPLQPGGPCGAAAGGKAARQLLQLLRTGGAL